MIPPIKDIKYEIGFSITDIGLSNSFLPLTKYLGSKIVFDFDEVYNDINLIVSLFSKLHYRHYMNRKLGIFDWLGFGVTGSFEAFGRANISETLNAMVDTTNNISEAGAAVFAGIDAPFYFHYKKFKVTIQPSVFLPVYFIDPDVSYIKYKKGSELDFNFLFRVYSIGSSQNGKSWVFPGMDLKISAEYPLLEVLDLGLDFISIPIVPSGMKNYRELSGSLSINEFKADNSNCFMTAKLNDNVFGRDKLMVFRPFKMLSWADWRPTPNLPLSIIPVLGFAVNQIYSKPVSPEAGLSTSYKLNELFVFSLGVCYTDRFCKNSLGIAVMLKHFQLDFGFDLRAKNYAQSSQGYGFGSQLGFTFRW